MAYRATDLMGVGFSAVAATMLFEALTTVAINTDQLLGVGLSAAQANSLGEYIGGAEISVLTGSGFSPAQATLIAGLLLTIQAPPHVFQYKQICSSFNFPTRTAYPNVSRTELTIKNRSASLTVNAKPITTVVTNNNIPASPAYTAIPPMMELYITDDTSGWICAPAVNGETPDVEIVWKILT